jgi:PKD repeat protein
MFLCASSLSFAQLNCHAGFYQHPGHHPNDVMFNASMNPPGTAYAWDFGDGATSSQHDPTHTYLQGGAYFACLTVTVTDSAGTVLCTDTWCDSVHVGPMPPPPVTCDAHFGTGSPWNNDTVFFNAAQNSPGTTYAWDFGDGSTGTGNHTSHYYSVLGVYYACLTVTNTDTAGNVVCTDTWCDSVHAGPQPPPAPLCDAHFSAGSPWHNDTIFFNTAHNSPGNTFAWDFGDGTTGTGSHASHYYSVLGVYYVCLTVTNTDTAGNVLCTDTWCDSVHAGPQPPPTPHCDAHFNTGSPWHNDTTFFNAAQNPPGSTYAWDFGDGTTGTGSHTSHYYSTTGFYYVCLIVTNTDTAGNVVCTDTWCDSIRGGPHAPPVPHCNAQFRYVRLHHSDTLHFHGGHANPNTTYAWDFGDGTTGTGSPVNHVYATPGMYWVCLTVTLTDSTGTITCSTTHCDSINTNHHPHPGHHHPPHHSPTNSNNTEEMSQSMQRTSTSLSFPAEIMNAIVFPNPSSENPFITLGNVAEKAILRIYTNNGSLVDEKEIFSSGNYKVTEKFLRPGMYFYQVVDGFSTVRGKFTIK